MSMNCAHFSIVLVSATFCLTDLLPGFGKKTFSTRFSVIRKMHPRLGWGQAGGIVRLKDMKVKMILQRTSLIVNFRAILDILGLRGYEVRERWVMRGVAAATRLFNGTGRPNNRLLYKDAWLEGATPGKIRAGFLQFFSLRISWVNRGDLSVQ